ncbi:MAG: hypothetical protein UHS47_05270 [Oscillospiraceae bacterium]|nr:hypothetical protein [Oscillospiraceae bacterium]
MSYYATISKSNFYVSTENTGRVLAKFQQLPYLFTLDDSGNIIGIQSKNCPQYSDLPVLQSIAPYVRDKSFILVNGEEQDIWKWVFENSTCRVVSPQLVWRE